MATISVAGSAVHHAPPELGTLRLAVTTVGDESGAVVAVVAARHEELSRAAADFLAQGAASSWSSQGVSSGAVWEWQPRPGSNDERVRRFQARADVTVTFTDFAALQSWALAAAGTEHVEVEGIEWDLTPQHRSELTDTTRTAATHDAVARAATYAAAAGLGEPRLLALQEEGLRSGGHDGGGQPFAKLARASFAADSGGAQLELHPREIEILVQITADFEAERTA